MTIEIHSRTGLAAKSAESDRRGFFKRAGTLGAVVVGTIAATWTDAPSAVASPFCCELLHPNGPWCGGTQGTNNFSCPTGYTKRYWTCGYMSCEFGCYECTQASSCWNGPWYNCSNWAILQYGGSGC
jgi:hypothetical protein